MVYFREYGRYTAIFDKLAVLVKQKVSVCEDKHGIAFGDGCVYDRLHYVGFAATLSTRKYRNNSVMSSQFVSYAVIHRLLIIP